MPIVGDLSGFTGVVSYDSYVNTQKHLNRKCQDYVVSGLRSVGTFETSI